MRLRILGSAAGGGFPQWNCACPNCAAVRAGSPRVRARTQDSIALEAAPGAWFLINVSPDIHQQIQATPDLWPRAGRASPIRGVVLLNADLDHTLGLFSLRENTPLVLHATESVWRALEGNTMLRTLQRFPEQLTWVPMGSAQPFSLLEDVIVQPMMAPGKVPKHLEGLAAPSAEENVGLRLEDRRTGRSALILPSSASVNPWMAPTKPVDVLIFDGTFWSSDELVTLGLGTARAEDMAHVPVGGERGSLAWFRGVDVGRKIYTHINNTNPILVEGSPERRAVEAEGWEVAEDGLEIQL